MVANPARRALVLDAALDVLGQEGARALTHRAVDARAAVPTGTTANYFRRRVDLFLGMAERIFDRLQPDPERLAELATAEGEDAFAAYVDHVVERLLAHRDLSLALVELRLEAARSREVADVLGPFLRAGLAADVAFHTERGLPGDECDVLALHHLIDGLVLDHLTVPLDPDANPRETAARLTRLLTSGRPTTR